MERTISLALLLLNDFLTHFNWSWHLLGRVATPRDPTHCTDPVYPIHKYRQMSTNIDFNVIFPGFSTEFQGFSRNSRILLNSRVFPGYPGFPGSVDTLFNQLILSFIIFGYLLIECRLFNINNYVVEIHEFASDSARLGSQTIFSQLWQYCEKGISVKSIAAKNNLNQI